LAWCRQGEAGSSEAAIDDVAAVLDLAEALSEGAHEVIGVGEGGVGLAAVVRPRLAQVRIVGGVIEKPASSSKQIQPPSAAEVFPPGARSPSLSR
jgi:hypothetical protein